ncbi:MAG: LPS export ABC transporter permease LptF [Pseudomonadota bacterium]
MIFQRALRHELAASAGATFTVLFSILVTWTLISILGKAAGGRVASGDVLALIMFAMLNYLPTVLTLTSFISVLMVVTRSYRDSEMVVWFASGLSLVRWIRPVLTFGLPLVVLVGTLSMIVTPWAKMKSTEFIQRFEKREDLKKVSPGQFKESSSSNRVFFVEGVSGESTVVQNVFVNTVEGKLSTVVVAKEGVIEADGKGGQFLVLKNGRRYQGTPGQADFQSMEFERYSMRVATKAAVVGAVLPMNATSSAVLAGTPTAAARGELLGRISAPLTCLLLILLAIPLGFVNPRAGSAANLIIALLIFITYTNLVSLMQASVTKGKIDFMMAWWPLHLVFGLWVLAMFAWRLNVNHRYHPKVIWAAFKRRHHMNPTGVPAK